MKKIKSSNAKRILPISEYQKRFFLEWALAPEESTYNTSLAFKIKGNLNKDALKQACEAFIQKHEIVHAQYSKDGNKCYYGNYTIDDFFHERKLDQTSEINGQLRDFLNTPFNLLEDVLLRFCLFTSSNDNVHYFMPSAHHIIADGTFAVQITRDIQYFYNQIIKDKPFDTMLEKTFSKAVDVETKTLTDNYKSAAKDYWLDFIGDLPLNVNLPYKVNINSINLDSKLADKTGRFIYFDLTTEQTKQLKLYAKQNRSTLFIVLSSIFGLVLSKYSNQEKLMLSYPIDMRPTGFKGVTGCFVNNVLLKIELEKCETLVDLISELNKQRRGAKKHQGYSLTNIIQDQREKSKSNINDSFFNVGFTQANLNTLPLNLDNLLVESVDISSTQNTINELGLLYDEYSSDKIKFKFEYRKELLDKHVIDDFLASFKELLNKVIANKNIELKNYSVLSKAKYQTIVYDWNKTEAPYPKDKTIYQLFEEQVEKTPDNIALNYSVDYTPIHQELLNNEIDEQSTKIFDYIFVLNKTLNEPEIDCHATFVIFPFVKKTDRFHYLATQDDGKFIVDHTLLKLLNKFVHKPDLYDLYNASQDSNNNLTLFEIKCEERESKLVFRRHTFSVRGDLQAYIALIKCLYVTGLLKIYGFNGDGYHQRNIHARKLTKLNGKYKNDIVTFNLKPEDLLIKKEKADIILLGDTVGTASVGLMYLASFLQKNGINAYCQNFDLCSNIKSLRNNVSALVGLYKPNYIGISMKWFMHISRVLKICEIVKELSPDTKIIIGGNTGSYYYKELIAYKCIDYIVRGDGEIPLLKICTDADYLPNAVYRKEDDVITNPIDYVQGKNNSSDIYLSNINKIFVSVLDYLSISSSIFIPVGKGCSMNCFYCWWL